MFEWQCETVGGEWVTEKFEANKMPSQDRYSKLILVTTQPLSTVLTFVVTYCYSIRVWSVVIND